YAEQKIIQTDLKSKDILKIKTPIPDNFLKLESETGNYCGSTNPKWKDKPLCEDISYPVYISPQVLEKNPTFGGITIENKKEIIIDKLSSKDQESQTDLTGQGILNQINQLQQKDNLNQQTIIGLQEEVADLEEKLL
ncbi:834_t:CDS:2, partial [Cetraspora pellucida]